jgi:hypothetical protein
MKQLEPAKQSNVKGEALSLNRGLGFAFEQVEAGSR